MKIPHSPGPFQVEQTANGLLFMLVRKLSEEERKQYEVPVTHNGKMSLLAVDKEGYACVAERADAILFANSPSFFAALKKIAALRTKREMNPRRGNSSEYVDPLAVLDDCIETARTALEGIQ